jgi:hypothetical protein
MLISQTKPRVKNKNPGEEGKPKARRQRVLAVVCLDNPNLVIDGMTAAPQTASFVTSNAAAEAPLYPRSRIDQL